MPNVSSPLGSTQDYIPLVRADQRWKCAGLFIICPDEETLDLWKADEIVNIAADSAIWPAGQLIHVSTDSDSEFRKWDGVSAFTLIDMGSSVDLSGYVPTTRTVNGQALSGNITILGNVDNTSDANKPVSTATQTALDLKVNKTTTVNGQALSGNVTLTKTDVGLSNVPNTDCTNASNITSGTLPIGVIPAAALERLYLYTGVETSPEAFGLTTAEVQNGDTVKINNGSNSANGQMWIVKDATALTTLSSFEPYTVGAASSVPWSGVTDKPTANTTTSGVLSSTDWNTFNNKLGSVEDLDIGSLTAYNPILTSIEFPILVTEGGVQKVTLSSIATALATWTNDVEASGHKITGAVYESIAEVSGSSTLGTSSLTLDFSTGNVFEVTLDRNITSIIYANLPSNLLVPCTIIFTQDATGGRTVTGWAANTKWPGGTAPTLTTAANAVDIISGYIKSTSSSAGTSRLALVQADSK